MEPPEFCPNCGAEVPPNARACPACGADEDTGWSDRATGQRLDLPDDEFDYDEFIKEEFGQESPGRFRTRGVPWFWWVIALGLAGLFLAMYWRF